MPFIDCKTTELESLFLNANPIEIEIGCGKGRFALEYARSHPRINIVGLDIQWRYMKHGDVRAKRRNLTNLAFLQVDAIQFLKEVVPDNSIAGFHMYCPDPWNKRRHMKRRMINTEFLTLIASKTLDGCAFIITTDRADYFEEINTAVQTVTDLWLCKHSQILTNALKTEEVLTNFELKYLEEGRDVFFLELVRRNKS